MALGAFAILVRDPAGHSSLMFPAAKKKGLPFLGRQPLVVQLLTGGWRECEASRYSLEQNYGWIGPKPLLGPVSGFTDPSFFPFFTVFAFAMVFSLLRIFCFPTTLPLMQSLRQTVNRIP
jgi:hypothetical protein